MALALIGAIAAVFALSRWHDRSMDDLSRT